MSTEGYKFSEVGLEIAKQDHRYGGRFGGDTALAAVRLGIACLEDEVREVLEAWHEERRKQSWTHTREELVQVAALAIRCVRLIDGDAAT